MSAVIEWEDPPSRRNGASRDWAAIAAALKARPGEWAVIAVCLNSATAASTARYVRESVYEPLRGDRYEAKARTVNGEARVYARYIGGEQ